jgi:predicted metal-dependent phosphoesterase TrpH
MKLRVQSHLHTECSKRTVGTDSSISEKVARENNFFRDSVDAFVKADHDTTNGTARWKEIGDEYGVTVISGIEIECREGHLLGIGVDERIERETKKNMPAQSASRIIKKYNGFVVVAHPFDPLRYGMGPKILKGLDVDCDAVEVHNSIVILDRPNRYADALADWLGVKKTVGADAHGIETVGYDLIEVDADDRSEEAIMEAMREGRIEIKKETVRNPSLQLMKEGFLEKIRINQDSIREKLAYGWHSSGKHQRAMKVLDNPLMKPVERALLEYGITHQDIRLWGAFTALVYVAMVTNDSIHQIKYRKLFEKLDAVGAQCISYSKS